MHASAAALCTGMQVYLLGAGFAVPHAGNSAWIASLAAVPAAALLAVLARKRLAQGGAARAGLCALAASAFLLAVFSCAALVSMAGQSLLPQAQNMRTAALTAVFISLCAASGRGEARLCFLLRLALPLGLILSAGVTLFPRGLHGVFPVLGHGAVPLALSAAAMTAAAAPVFIIMLPPEALTGIPDSGRHLPSAAFLARRAAAGAFAGCIPVFLLCAGGDCQALQKERLFGARLLALAGGGAHQGVFDTAVTLLLTAACALHTARMLSCAADAACLAFPRIKGGPVLLFPLGASLLAVLWAFSALGETPAPILGLIAALPGLFSAAAGKKTGKMKRGTPS